VYQKRKDGGEISLKKLLALSLYHITLNCMLKAYSRLLQFESWLYKNNNKSQEMSASRPVQLGLR